jgi:hypothetical protein
MYIGTVGKLHHYYLQKVNLDISKQKVSVTFDQAYNLNCSCGNATLDVHSIFQISELDNQFVPHHVLFPFVQALEYICIVSGF